MPGIGGFFIRLNTQGTTPLGGLGIFFLSLSRFSTPLYGWISIRYLVGKSGNGATLQPALLGVC